MLEVVLPGLLVHRVPEGDGGGDEGVEHGEEHDHNVEDRVVDDLVTNIWSISSPLKVINCHQTPLSFAITLQNLLGSNTR